MLARYHRGGGARRPVELGIPPDVVVDFGLKLLAVPVVPGLRRKVLSADEHRLGLPVVALPWQKGPTLQPQHSRAVRGKSVPECPTSGSRPDDDNVVVLVVCHAGSLLERWYLGLPLGPLETTMSRLADDVITQNG